MKFKKPFIDYYTLSREPLTEKEKGLVESAMKHLSKLRKRYNVKTELLESPHKEDAFSDVPTAVRQRMNEEVEKESMLRLQYKLFDLATEYYDKQGELDRYPVKFIRNTKTGKLLIIANEDYSKRLINFVQDL